MGAEESELKVEGTEPTDSTESAISLRQMLIQTRAELIRKIDEELGKIASAAQIPYLQEDPAFLEKLLTPISALGLSVRAKNALGGIHSFSKEPKHKPRFVGEIIESTENELSRLRNCGRKSVKEIKLALAKHGFQLGTIIEPEIKAKFRAAVYFK